MKTIKVVDLEYTCNKRMLEGFITLTICERDCDYYSACDQVAYELDRDLHYELTGEDMSDEY